MKSSIIKFILAHSIKQQIKLLVLILASMPFLYAVLEMPKEIINDAIDGHKFPVMVMGYELEQIPFLLTLCAGLFGLVLINGGFKYVISVYKGLLGERMLRRLRYELGSQVLRFPLPHFRKMSQGEIITMITAEVEPLGGFIGDAVAIPALEGGRMLTILVFMFLQDPYLGAAAIFLYPLQMYLIPKLQKQVNALAKKRVIAVRSLSERLGETISGIKEVHANDTSEWERADLSHHLGGIYNIRFQIYRKKFLIKFLNNFLAQMTPLMFYSIGGYLVIQGDLSFGALVAVLAAYKDLSEPWKDLLNYYQGMENAKIKYRQLTDQFRPNGMLEPDIQGAATDVTSVLHKSLTANYINFEGDNGITLVNGATFKMKLGEKVCVLSPDHVGTSELSQIVVRLLMADSGTTKLENENLAKLPESITGRRFSYVGEGASLFSGTILNNLLYGLKHEPLCAPSYDHAALCAHQDWVDEAKTSGNATHDIAADWIDYAAAGLSGPSVLSERLFEVLKIVNLNDGLYELGLKQSLDPAQKPEITDRILRARLHLRQKLQTQDSPPLFEPFHQDRYNSNLSVAENLLFGMALDEDFSAGKLASNPYVIDVLEQVDLYEKFVEIGSKLADIMVDMFKDISPDHEFFRRFSFIQADDLPNYIHCLRCIDADGIESLEAKDKSMLATLPFNLVTARHRLGLIDEAIQQDILRARHLFAQNLPESKKAMISFFDEESYNAAASIQDNILFGKVIYGKAEAERTVNQMITQTIQDFDLQSEVLEAGLQAEVGIGGSRLSGVYRQKIAIARALLKRPDLLVMDSATSILPAPQALSMMQNIIKDVGDRGLFWVLNDVGLANNFERVLVLQNGQIVEQGPVSEMDKPGSVFHELAAV